MDLYGAFVSFQPLSFTCKPWFPACSSKTLYISSMESKKPTMIAAPIDPIEWPGHVALFFFAGRLTLFAFFSRVLLGHHLSKLSKRGRLCRTSQIEDAPCGTGRLDNVAKRHRQAL
jgi:hypothetical protein